MFLTLIAEYKILIYFILFYFLFIYLFYFQSSLDNDVPAIQTDRSCLFLYTFSVQMVPMGNTTVKRKERMVFLCRPNGHR